MNKIKITLLLSLLINQIYILSNEQNQQTKTPMLKTPKKGIDIQKVMNYPIPNVIARYKKDHKDVSDEDAKIHERELKRYLIVCAENLPEPISMFSPKVDNLWHSFLLFTKDYAKFCEECFGEFIHHVPKTHEEQSK